jgi:hypothetical protein
MTMLSEGMTMPKWATARPAPRSRKRVAIDHITGLFFILFSFLSLFPNFTRKRPRSPRAYAVPSDLRGLNLFSLLSDPIRLSTALNAG